MAKRSILNDVINYKNKNTVRFHMPGHAGKGIGAFFDCILACDLTELPETDNLYEPADGGSVEALCTLARSLFCSHASLLSVGGATLALQAAAAAAARRGKTKKVLCDRRCHRSVIYALALTGEEPVWFLPDSVNSLEEALRNGGGAFDAAIVTSPDYYGRLYDVAAIKKALPENTPLIADCSHGAHLAFFREGELHPLRQGADISVDSLHKTLPAMTGTALLNSGTAFEEGELRSAMKIFASTSPSYILISSGCACLEYINNNKDAFGTLYGKVRSARRRLAELGFQAAENDDNKNDPFRIRVADGRAKKLYEHLYNRNVVCEFADDANVIIIPSLLNSERDFDALIEGCRAFRPSPPSDIKYRENFPAAAMSARRAVFAESERILIKNAAGRIASSPATPYPPGIPAVMPGEIIDAEVIAALERARIKYIDAVK